MSPVNVSSIGSFVREQREQAKISIRQLAQAAGVPNSYLGQIERGLRKPSADLLQQLAKGLRISAEVLYVQAGILEDRPHGVSVRTVVLDDPDLNERQKQMLIELYDSFRKEAALAAGPEAALAAGPEAALAAGPEEPADASPHAGDAESTSEAESASKAEPEHMVPSPAASR